MGYPSPAGRPSVNKPATLDLQYQGKDDPRYSSPRLLRTVLAFTVDQALSLTSGVGAFFACNDVPKVATYIGHSMASLTTVDGLIALVVVSLVNRVLIQWAFRATIGKALFGLVVIRRRDGGRPGFWRLARAWFTGVWYGIAALADTFGNTNSGTDYQAESFFPAVRYRDVRALRHGYRR
jgi:RDD family protein